MPNERRYLSMDTRKLLAAHPRKENVRWMLALYTTCRGAVSLRTVVGGAGDSVDGDEMKADDGPSSSVIKGAF